MKFLIILMLSLISFGQKRLELLNIYCNSNVENETVSRCVISGKFVDSKNQGWQKKYSEEFVLQQNEKNQLENILKRMIQKKKSDEGL